MTTKLLTKKLEKEIGQLTFGMFLRASRTSLGISQQEMATQLGMARGTLCDIEKGRQLVSIELAKKIAKKAGLSTVAAVEACFADQLKKSKLKKQLKQNAAKRTSVK